MGSRGCGHLSELAGIGGGGSQQLSCGFDYSPHPPLRNPHIKKLRRNYRARDTKKPTNNPPRAGEGVPVQYYFVLFKRPPLRPFGEAAIRHSHALTHPCCVQSPGRAWPRTAWKARPCLRRRARARAGCRGLFEGVVRDAR